MDYMDESIPGVDDLFKKRRKIIDKIEKNGISPKTALKALAEEASYLVRTRIADMQHPEGKTPEQIDRVIQLVEKAGFNSRSIEELMMANNNLETIKQLTGKNIT